MTSLSKPRLKRCKAPGCDNKFAPRSAWQAACSMECAMAVNDANKAKGAKQQAKEERARLRERREKVRTRSWYVKAAQAAFNAFIRARDAGQPCICCGRPLGDGAIGGGYDCGHYRSVGSAPHLRFDPRNAHAQNKQCNRYGAGRAVDYRLGLIARIGLEAVEALEADQEPRKYSVEDLKAIKAEYVAKRKEIEKERQG